MLLLRLVRTSHAVAQTRARSQKIEQLAELLKSLEGKQIHLAVSYLTGALPQGRIGIGPAAVRTALTEAPAEQSRLTLSDVDTVFERIAGVAGAGSNRERGRLLAELFRGATSDEQQFLARLLFGELRQGALAGLMVAALAATTELPLSEVRRAWMLAGDLPQVAVAALTEGRAGLSRFRLQLLRPLQPMLAQPADDLYAAIERLGEAALEYKLDGARVQVHRSGDEVRVFSRRLHDVTAAVPELVETVRSLPVRSILLDGEVLALRADGSPQPFQVTMRRFGRKLEVEQARRRLPLTPFFFDLLHVDGDDLIDRPAAERVAALRGSAPGLVVPHTRTADPDEADEFFRQAIEQGHEGIMAKEVDATYAAGSRGSAWLKIKPAHTLDLVVLAVEQGSGRRKGWLSNIHLGARDPSTGGFVMLGKTFKGMTDRMLEWQTKRFRELSVATDGYTVHLRPEVVVEIAFSDVQESPQYPAGMALRFARVKRYREDKTADQADTVETVRRILEGGRKRSG